jgi:hypothetical protein
MFNDDVGMKIQAGESIAKRERLISNTRLAVRWIG